MPIWKRVMTAVILLLAQSGGGCGLLYGGSTSFSSSSRAQTAPLANRPTALICASCRP